MSTDPASQPQATQAAPPLPPASPYQAGAGYPMAAVTPPQPQRAGFFRSLFDLRYEAFAAPRVAAFIQVVVLVLSSIAVGVVIVGLLMDGGFERPGPTLLLVLLAPLAWLLLNVMVRVGLEVVVAVVKTAENTDQMIDLLREGRR